MDELSSVIKSLIAEKKSDFYIFRAEINDENVDKFIYLVRDKENKNQTCSIILTTYGGDPDAGYRLVRFIDKYYKKFHLYVFGSCKSTGTLIALGAHEIIMSDFGEFGPLDIQLTRDDELSSTSGLNYFKALESLNQQVFQCFEQNFLGLKRNSGNTITTRTAGEIASKLAVGLISPISAQIEPVKLGEVTRSMVIAESYGERITDNHDLILRLITDYPSHSFVIDFKEAKTLFDKTKVRLTDDNETKLERIIIKVVRNEMQGKDKAMIMDLSLSIEDAEHSQQENQLQQTENINNDNDVIDNTETNTNFEQNQSRDETSGIHQPDNQQQQ